MILTLPILTADDFPLPDCLISVKKSVKHTHVFCDNFSSSFPQTRILLSCTPAHKPQVSTALIIA